jgi:hypothetical protein
MDRSLQRIFLALVATTALAAVVPARAAEFGQLDGGTPSSGLSGDFKRGSRVTLTEPGVVTSLKAKLDGFGGPQTGSQFIHLSLYTDVNGVPGVKLADSGYEQIQTQSPAGIHTFYTDSVPLPAGTYWVVLHTAATDGTSTAGIIRDYGTALSGNNWYANADTYSDGTSSPFGPGTTGNTQLAVGGTSQPATLSKFAGRATVAATPSGGLTANAKRGSRFTMTEKGRVTSLTAYLDGKGGGMSSQKVRYALYRDSGGLPGALIVQSAEVNVQAGQAASWVSAGVTPVDLTPGNYWIVIHTGDNTGVVRDYGDGAANWYSNADTYSDGASATFGPGNTGTVTLSAAAVYYPGAIETRTMGRTTAAGIPSGGLSANYSRGSHFGDGAFNIPEHSTITAFWAYLDGNGGASGSQQLRIALYSIMGEAVPYNKVAESAPVIIPAGMPPQWVRFPLAAPTPIGFALAYQFMLQSGNTGGVARDYGDGDANWIGFPDDFADGPVNALYPDPSKQPGLSNGTVTLSLYMEYTVPVESP